MRKWLLFLLIFTLVPFGNQLSAQENEPLAITARNAASLTKLASLSNGRIDHAEWSPDGELLMLVGSFGIRLFNIDDLGSALGSISGVFEVAGFMPNGQEIYAVETQSILDGGHEVEALVIWDIETLEKIGEFTQPDAFGYDIWQVWPLESGIELALWYREDSTPLYWTPEEGNVKALPDYYCDRFLPEVRLDFPASIWQYPISDQYSVCVLNLPVAMADGSMLEIAESIIFDQATGQRLLSLATDQPIYAAIPDHLVTETGIYNLATGQLKFGFEELLFGDVSSTGLVAGIGQNAIHLIDGVSGEILYQITGLPFPAKSTQFHPSDPLLLIQDVYGQIYIWDFESQALVAHTQNFLDTVRQVQFGPESKTLYLMSEDYLTKWDTESGIQQIIGFAGTQITIDGVFGPFVQHLAVAEGALSPDATTLIGAYLNTNLLSVVSIDTASEVNRLELEIVNQGDRFEYPVASPIFSPDGTWMAVQTIHNIGEVWIYDLLDGPQNPVFFTALPMEGIGTIGAFSPDGKLLAYNSYVWIEGQEFFGLTVWEIETGSMVYQDAVISNREYMNSSSLDENAPYIPNIVAFSPDNEKVAYVRQERTPAIVTHVEVVDIIRQTTIADIAIPTDKLNPPSVQNLYFTADSNAIVALSTDGPYSRDEQLLSIWNIKSGEELFQHSFQLNGNPEQGIFNGTASIDLSPDGNLLALATTEGFIELWGLPENNSEFATPQSNFVMGNIEQTLAAKSGKNQILKSPSNPEFAFYAGCPPEFETSFTPLSEIQLPTNVVDSTIRGLPLSDSAEVEVLESGSRFLVGIGPVCEGNTAWWPVIYDRIGMSFYDTEYGDVAVGWLGESYLEAAASEQNPPGPSTTTVLRVTDNAPGDIFIRPDPSRATHNNLMLTIGSEVEVIDGPIYNEGFAFYEVLLPTGTTGFIPNNESEGWVEITQNAVPSEAVIRCQNGNLPALFAIGEVGYPSFGWGNSTLRTALNGNPIMDVPEGELFTVIGGPLCADNGTMWYEIEYQENTGWVSQGNDENGYWISRQD